jgi:hypothetical protein
MIKSSKALALPALALCVAAGQAVAHHSSAMFEADKVATVTGTVKEFQYTQPHCWLVVMVPGANGAAAQEWRIEAGAPTLLLRLGIEKATFPVGEPVTVSFHPLKDGRAAGEFIKATLNSGKEVGMGFGPPPPGAPQS